MDKQAWQSTVLRNLAKEFKGKVLLLPCRFVSVSNGRLPAATF